MNQYGYSDQALEDFAGASAGIVACYFIFLFAIIVFTVWVWWRILSKAGYSGALALLNLVPFGTFVLMLMLAFGDWPALRQLRGGQTFMPTQTAPSYQAPPPYEPPTYQPPSPPMAQAPEPAAPVYQPPVAPPAAPPVAGEPAPSWEPPAAPPAPPAPPTGEEPPAR